MYACAYVFLPDLTPASPFHSKGEYMTQNWGELVAEKNGPAVGCAAGVATVAEFLFWEAGGVQPSHSARPLLRA